MRSIVYHQFRRNCISSTSLEVVYHQADRNAHLWCDEIQLGVAVLMIYTLTRDDIPSLSAWIKKHSFKRTSVFWLPCWVSEDKTIKNCFIKRCVTKHDFTSRVYRSNEKEMRLTLARSGTSDIEAQTPHLTLNYVQVRSTFVTSALSSQMIFARQSPCSCSSFLLASSPFRRARCTLSTSLHPPPEALRRFVYLLRLSQS